MSKKRNQATTTASAAVDTSDIASGAHESRPEGEPISSDPATDGLITAGPTPAGPTPAGPTRHGQVLSWAADIDGQTLAQAHRSAKLDIVAPHVALMPDAHFGMGATVGSVIPTKNAIIPSAVGVDIGCGMIASRLNIGASALPDDLTKLHGGIAAAVPAGVGMGHQYQRVPVPELPRTVRDGDWWTPKMIRKVRSQFGSLGSGNHFIEVCLDEADQVWVVLHSGSRGIGNMLARHHIEGAKREMKRLEVALEDPDLSHFMQGTQEFDDYICDMLWSQGYAMANRQRMMDLVLAQVRSHVGEHVRPIDTINCHHNFTERERHYGADMWITRKGAIRANVGDRGVIPGSMGAETFVVRGKGNTESFRSCSHGAGRKMSRGQAKKLLTAESLEARMAGVAWNVDAEALLDEHPDAYKDINQVMAAQSDLVAIEHTLHQVLNYKGT